MFDFERGFSGIFTLFGIGYLLTTLLVVGVFVFIIVMLVTRWRKNEKSPRLTVPATVVSKRTHLSHSSHSHGSMHPSSSTYYYVTFQLESGDRMELPVCGNDFGLMVEGDRGMLTFQGTRFLSFDRG